MTNFMFESVLNYIKDMIALSLTIFLVALCLWS